MRRLSLHPVNTDRKQPKRKVKNMPDNQSNRFNVEAIKAAGSRFKTSIGNGKAALAAAVFLMESVAETRDTSPIVKMMKDAKDKGDDNAKNAVGLIARTLFPGAKFSVDKNKQPIFKISGINANAEVLAEIAGWVDADNNGVFSIRGKQVREKLAEYQPEPTTQKTPEQLLEARMKADVKWMEENGISLEAYIAKLTTLRNN